MLSDYGYTLKLSQFYLFSLITKECNEKKTWKSELEICSLYG